MRVILSVLLFQLVLPCWLMGFTPIRPDPLSELHRWEAQPDLDQEILYVGDRDAEGVIWLAGDSRLLAYDGHAVEQHAFPEAWPDMGSGKDILSAENGALYAFYQNGLIRFHPSRGFHLLRSSEEPAEKSTSLAETADGSVWIGIRDGLFRMEAGEMEPVDCGFDSIRAVEVDANGDLWIANEENEIRIFRYEPSTGPIPELLEQISLPADLYGHNSHIYRKPDGTMWMLITHPTWVVIEFTKDRTIQRIPIPDGFESAIGFSYCPMPDGRIIFTEKSTTAQFYQGEWIRLNLDDYPVATHESFAISLPGNRLLIGGSHTQRYLIDLSDERWTTFLDLIFCDEDEEGNEWYIHKTRDVIVHDPTSGAWSALTEEDGLINSPNSVYSASDGTVWVSGMHEGNAALSYFKAGQWQRHSFPGLGYSLGHLAVCELPDGNLVFGNGSDGYFDTRPGGAVICRPSPDGLDMKIMGQPYYPERPYCITTTRGHNGLWIGGRNLHFKSGPESKDLILNERFQRSWTDHMIVDSAGTLWVANWRLGLFRYDGKTWEELRGTDNRSSIQAAFIFQRNQEEGIWIGNTEGLHRYDGQTWSHSILGDHFRFAKEAANMVEGKAGDLWLNFSSRDWLLNSPVSQGNRPHAHRTIRYRADLQPPETEFTRLEDELNEPANAIFSWKGRDRWEDTARNDLEFSYRLSGRDWTPFSKRTEIALLDLPAGDYTIEVRARDQDFNVDPSPAMASFLVVPPLWKQTWFIIVLASVVASTILLIAIIIRQRITHAVALSEFKVDF
ncbi:MAG TPA: hypothetical protein VJ960_09445, partial [Oceanipulchritudo sp.]|nr:hypothetical protein [Oceanipulchritudo sp.]